MLPVGATLGLIRRTAAAFTPVATAHPKKEAMGGTVDDGNDANAGPAMLKASGRSE